MRRTVRGHRTKTVYLNRLNRLNATIYVIVILFLGMLVVYYSAALEKNKLTQTNRDATNEIMQYFQNKDTNFYSVYMPMFKDKKNGDEAALLEFFLGEYQGNPDTNQSAEDVLLANSDTDVILDMIESVMAQDSDIQWVFFHRNLDEDVGYLGNVSSSTKRLESVSDFPFLSEVMEKTGIHKILGSRYVATENDKSATRCFAITGGVFYQRQCVGSMTVGYSTAAFDTIYRKYDFNEESILPTILIATTDGSVIYDSSGQNYGSMLDIQSFDNSQEGTMEVNGVKQFVEVQKLPEKGAIVICTVPWNALNLLSHKNTPLIIGVTVFFAVLAASLYELSGHLSSRRVNVILDSLEEIGKDNLSYRVPVINEQDEFGVIASTINRMTDQLQEYVNKVYIYSIKQKNAELGELQAKFNPHFLYNTLEVIRAQLQEKGDVETADMVLLLSRIFRNFINKKPFVTIQEEISLCDVYLELFRLRYRDTIQIEFDIDTEVLRYGIIRNLLQPVIENYFVHGFVAGSVQNCITITGALEGQDYIILTVEDNGTGIEESRLKEIEEELGEPSADGDKDGEGGYGLKNLHDRIHVFYGEKCGVTITSDTGKGTKIALRICQMTVEEHEQQMRMNQ